MADDNLAYGHYPGRPEEGETDRGMVGDSIRRFQQSESIGSIFNKLQEIGNKVGGEIESRLGGPRPSASYVAPGTPGIPGATGATGQGGQHRYDSFAQPRDGNDVKWHVDGCAYFWAVSVALEQARESIWILDWWLSPEVYLRRPPSQNEQYRIDRMLQAAAQRGVKVNIIVYKEVSQALTLSSVHTKHALEALHPNIAVFRHPDHMPDAQTLSSSFASSFQNLSVTGEALAKLPGDAIKALYGVSEDVILYWAHHEKLCLIDGHTAFMGGLDLCYGRWDPNQHPIADAHPENLDMIVFPGQEYNNARIMDFENVSQYEQNKLDRKVSSRMGWSDISISLHGTVVQDLRFHFVQRWNFIYNEKYDVRKDTRYSRLSLNNIPQTHAPQPTQQSGAASQQPFQQGQEQYFAPPPQSEGQQHYPPPPPQTSQATQQPNYHHPQSTEPPPYTIQQQENLPPAPAGPPPPGSGQHNPPQPPGPPSSGNQPLYQYNPATYTPGPSQPQYQAYHPSAGSDQAHGGPGQSSGQQYFPPPPVSERELSEGTERGLGSGPTTSTGRGHHSLRSYEEEGQALAGKVEEKMHLPRHLHSALAPHLSGAAGSRTAGMGCQIVRSATKWSNGTPTEHSIQNAYATTIRQSQHCVYIENQFFITATGNQQKPVQNTIGAAIVERILRAARAGEKYKMFVVMPAVPGFAGDLKDDSSLGTRAIMDFQYKSINRGGHSIMEEISKAGFDPTEYIRFFNLRNYDRINAGSSMKKAEQASGIDYETARQEHDAMVDPTGYRAQQGLSSVQHGHQNYDKYQQSLGVEKKKNDWNTVSECYMLGGPDIREIPWEDGDLTEMEAFVSEELYIHSKVLIADDRIVICGSANLNDRSQLGTHDSEIACVIEDNQTIDSSMNGRPFKAAKFAATLRRFLFRKHLGLVRAQDWRTPDANFFPVGTPNNYDYNSPEDRLVADPLADQFLNFWYNRARTNTYAFERIFHPVPHDDVRTWADYDSYYEQFFKKAEQEAEGKSGSPLNRWGHVVSEKFAKGPQGAKEVKDMLSTIKGTLVEMPLLFLIKENIAKEGLSLNAFTEVVYT